MKRLIGTALVVTLILSAAPVLAGDTFHALSRLPAAQATPLDDAQLAAIEGGDMCVACVNIADVSQLANVVDLDIVFSAVKDVDIDQKSVQVVSQEIN